MPSVTTKPSKRSTPAADGTNEPTKAPRKERKPSPRWRPTKAIVHRQLGRLAERAPAKATRQAITSLAKRIKAGPEGAESVDGLIERVLSTADTSSPDGLLLAEALTWAVAWRQGSRAPGNAAHLAAAVLELASTACADLAQGETAAAAFVLIASRLLSAVAQQNDVEQIAWDACETEIQRLVTPSGCVSLEGSAAIVARVARWTHVRAAAATTAEACHKPKQTFTRNAEQRWKQSLATAITLLGPGGQAIAVNSAHTLPNRACEDITDAALEHGKKSLRKAVRLLRQPQGTKGEDDALSPNLDDRNAAMAILRSRWQGRATRVLLDYRSEHPTLEVSSGKRMLLAGVWRSEVTLSGAPLPVESPWQVTHFEEIDESTTLVISAALGEGLRLERHVVLAPEDRVLLLADAVVDSLANNTPIDLGYRCSLPVANDVAIASDEQTRELELRDTKPLALVMPLAFNEWLAGHANGRFQWDSGSRQLHLEQRSPVRRLFAPLWFDLDPRRFRSQVTWRQLTVADTRVNVRPEQAAGFRIQSGLTNWVLYRSLDEPRNRTVLGLNLSSYFRLGKLGTDGLVSQMAEW